MTRPQAVAALAATIDHTRLAPGTSASEVDRLCAEAREYGFAAVCVNPWWVARCARGLRGTPIAVCTVVGFPLGATSTSAKVCEATQAIADGASEADIVMNAGALKSGDREATLADLSKIIAVCRGSGVLSKVILETGLLTDGEKTLAATLARSAGADFVKTSTGFGPGGATVHDVALLRRVVGSAMGVKASGGIRDLASAQAMLAAGATRLGASAGVQIVTEAGWRPFGSE